MTSSSTAPQSIDAYIASRPTEHHVHLQRLRSLAHACIPDAEECISYGMPALRRNGRVIVWFASFRHHVGLFPRAKAIEVFAEELQAYSTSKGTIRFDLSTTIPSVLVRKVIRFCLKEQTSLMDAKKTSPKVRTKTAKKA